MGGLTKAGVSAASLAPVARLASAPEGDAGVQAPAVPTMRGHLDASLQAVLASYSQVLFSRSRLVGLLVMAATFVVPEVGLVGLFGVATACALATVLGLDRESVRTGVLGYNALLVFLMVGALLQRSPAFWGLAVVLAGLVVLVHVGLATALQYHLRLPALSLPFVVVSWVALSAVPYVRGMALRPTLPAFELPKLDALPAVVDTFLVSLGAIFFQPHWTAGALVLAALLRFSRIATLHAAVGFAVAMAADAWLFTFPQGFLHQYVGFNFIMTAVALGGIFYVPGPASMVLAGLGSLGCGLMSVATMRALQPLGLPVLALPFNLVALVVLYALAHRGLDARPRPVDFVAGSPEDNLNHWRTRVARFRSGLPVRLQLPVRGRWVVTQGHDGEHTHRGAWRHGLDFEVADRRGQRHHGSGEQLTDWLCYGLPVRAMAAGTVVRVIDGLPDTPVGEQDTERNWGNCVVVQHAVGVYALLAHLQPASIAVVEGEVVAAGQVLAKVGSSGRSPVPHLHVQLQATPTLGDPTIPIEFGAVVVDGEVRERCVPMQGQAVRNVERADAVARALAFPVGERLQVVVEGDGERWLEELISDVDLLGRRSLVSPSRDARLWFDNTGSAFVAYDVAGPWDSALFALYAALARVPMEESALRWEDHLNPRRLGSRPLAWFRDALAALVPPTDQAMAYVSGDDDGVLLVRGGSPARAGQRGVQTEARIEPGRGLLSVDVAVGKRRLRVEVQR